MKPYDAELSRQTWGFFDAYPDYAGNKALQTRALRYAASKHVTPEISSQDKLLKANLRLLNTIPGRARVSRPGIGKDGGIEVLAKLGILLNALANSRR